MNLKFFTQRVSMFSPTYYKALEGKMATSDKDWPFVDMTADISLSVEEYEEGGEEWQELDVSISNRMWEDPLEDKNGNKENFCLQFSLSREEAIYFKNYLEAFLSATEK